MYARPHLVVCAMYENDKYILGILFIFAGAQSATMAISARMVVPGLGTSPTCMVVGSHPGQLYVGLAILNLLYFRSLSQDQRLNHCSSSVHPCYDTLAILPRQLAGTLTFISQNYGSRQYLYGHCGDR
jgi:hypothetical protein